jgi:hypothetical protein
MKLVKGSHPELDDLSKVVIRVGSRAIKGYLESSDWGNLDSISDLLSRAAHDAPQTLCIRDADSDMLEEVSTADLKALFFVNSFDGQASRKRMNFHSRTPIVDGIWMRVKFLDGEVMEGIAYNSLRYLVDPGFFMLPTDPESNNKLVYVLKAWIADHHVLGMRRL